MRNRIRIILLSTATISLIGFITLYYNVNPERHEFFPKCIIYSLTGMQCPSCGSQRALHAILHGNLSQALHYNLFALYSVPYFILVLICYFWQFNEKKLQNFRAIILSRAATIAYVVGYFGWWIIRNIFGW